MSIDAEYQILYPPDSASVPYAFDNLVIYPKEFPTTAPVSPFSDIKFDAVSIPIVFTKLLTILTWLTWFEYSITAASNAV